MEKYNILIHDMIDSELEDYILSTDCIENLSKAGFALEDVCEYYFQQTLSKLSLYDESSLFFYILRNLVQTLEKYRQLTNERLKQIKDCVNRYKSGRELLYYDFKKVSLSLLSMLFENHTGLENIPENEQKLTRQVATSLAIYELNDRCTVLATIKLLQKHKTVHSENLNKSIEIIRCLNLAKELYSNDCLGFKLLMKAYMLEKLQNIQNNLDQSIERNMHDLVRIAKNFLLFIKYLEYNLYVEFQNIASACIKRYIQVSQQEIHASLLKVMRLYCLNIEYDSIKFIDKNNSSKHIIIQIIAAELENVFQHGLLSPSEFEEYRSIGMRIQQKDLFMSLFQATIKSHAKLLRLRLQNMAPKTDKSQIKIYNEIYRTIITKPLEEALKKPEEKSKDKKKNSGTKKDATSWHELQWKDVYFGDGQILIKPKDDNGQPLFEPKVVVNKLSSKSFNYIISYFEDRLPAISYRTKEGKIISVNEIKLNQAVLIIKENEHELKIKKVNTTKANLNSRASLSFETTYSMASQLNPGQFKKYKSKYIDTLVKQQMQAYRIVPVCEALTYVDSAIWEDGFLFTLQMLYEEVYVQVVLENINPDRSTVVFLVQKSQYMKALKAIFTFFQGNTLNKRSQIRARRLQFKDYGITSYKTIHHEDFSSWKTNLWIF